MSMIGTMKTCFATLTVMGMLAAAAPAHAQTQPVVAVQTVTDEMQTMFPPNTGTAFDFLGGVLMPGTNPGIAAVSGYPYAIAFASISGTLWFGWPDEGLDYNLGDTGLLVKPGTSPSVASAAPAFRVAFQSNTGELVVYSNLGGTINTHLGMMAGTSPSITSLASGGYEVAFQANTGALWVYSSTGAATATSVTLMPRTSPAIVGMSGGDFEIAYQTSAGKLGFMSSTLTPVTTTLAVMAGTSPAITKLSSSFKIAFQGTTGTLWTAVPSGGSATGTNSTLAMMPGTNPAIGAFGTGVQMAFQAPTGLLWYVPPTGSAVATTETVQTGTSPTMAVY